MSTISSTVENPLKQLTRFGQSIWLDYIRRSLMTSGQLRRMVEEDGLGGMTSNPSIFEKAIEGGDEYADYLKQLKADKSLDAKGVYERLAIRDIQDAADVLRPVYASTERRDGYVSLEVAPYLAHKTQDTIDEALRLWKAVNRPNLMIKIPGTPAGVPAIETVLREGVNVNVTLLFAQEMYEEVAWAYVRALEQRASAGRDLAGMAGVASFFVSRIDTAVDALIDARLPQADDAQRSCWNPYAARRRLPMPSWPMSATSAFFRGRAGTLWRPRARKRNACCGPARRPKIPSCGMCCISKS